MAKEFQLKQELLSLWDKLKSIPTKKIQFKNFKLDFSNHYPIIITLFFILLIFQYPLSTLESILYDLRLKFDFMTKASDEIVLVYMDHESDEYLGDSYPYTYSTHLKAFKKLQNAGAAQILYFNEFLDSKEEDEFVVEDFKKSIEEFRQAGGSVRLANFQTSQQNDVVSYSKKIFLEDVGYSWGDVQTDSYIFSKDDVPRRTVLNVSGEESIHLWAVNQKLKKSKKQTYSVLDFKGAYYNEEFDANLTLFRYATNPVDGHMKFKSIPFHRIMVGNFNKNLIENKIVLIGPGYFSNRKYLSLSPFNLEEFSSTKLAIHGNIINSFLERYSVVALPRIVSQVMSIFIAILLSIIISRLTPRDGLVIAVIMLLSVILLSYFLFVFFGLWLYTAHLLVTVFVVYYIWIPFRAIGEYQRRFAIQEETKLLKKVENLKQNFISLMSHDLKTPVAKIQGLADMLGRVYGHKEPEVKVKSMQIIEATRELNKFITSILDLTKIESSNFGLNKTTKDINLIIDEVLGELRYEAQVNGTELLKELSPLYPIAIDTNLIKRVISNLVENALKYSGHNKVVKIKSWDDDQYVYVEIIDNGVGIPPEEIGNIFDKFYRIKNDASHSIKGSGLGLYLVKYFVELHEGKIEVSSTPNVETKFLVKFKNIS